MLLIKKNSPNKALNDIIEVESTLFLANTRSHAHLHGANTSIQFFFLISFGKISTLCGFRGLIIVFLFIFQTWAVGSLICLSIISDSNFILFWTTSPKDSMYCKTPKEFPYRCLSIRSYFRPSILYTAGKEFSSTSNHR